MHMSASIVSVFISLFVTQAIGAPIDYRECLPKVPLCREISTQTECEHSDSGKCEWLSDVYSDSGLTSVTYNGICVNGEDRVSPKKERINCDDESLFQNKTACDETKNCQWDDTDGEFEFCDIYTCNDIHDEVTCEHFSVAELSHVACEWVDGFCMVPGVLQRGDEVVSPDNDDVTDELAGICGTFIEETECSAADDIVNCVWKDDVGCAFGTCLGWDESPCKRIRGCFWRDDAEECADFRTSVISAEAFRPDASKCTSFSSDNDTCLNTNKALGCMWEVLDSRESSIARCRGPCRTQFAETYLWGTNCVTYATFYNKATGELMVDENPGCRSPLRDGDGAGGVTYDLQDAFAELNADFGDERDIMCFDAYNAEPAECNQIQSEADCGQSSTNCKWAEPQFQCNFRPCGRGSPCSPSTDCTLQVQWENEIQGPICCSMLDVYCKNYGEEDPACFNTHLIPFARRYNCSQIVGDAATSAQENFCHDLTTEEDCTNEDIAGVCTWKFDTLCFDSKALDAKFDSSLGASPCFDAVVMFDSTACNKLAPRCAWQAMSYDDVEDNGDGYCTEAACWTQETKADCISFGDKDDESNGCIWVAAVDADVMGSCQEPEPDDTYKIDVGDGFKQPEFNVDFSYDACSLHDEKSECDAQAACYFVILGTDSHEPDPDLDVVDPDEVTGYCDIAMCGVMETKEACVSFDDDCVWLDMDDEGTHEGGGDNEEEEIEHYAYCVDKSDQDIDENGNPFDNPSVGESFYLSKCFGDTVDTNETACNEEPMCMFITDKDSDFTMCTEVQCYQFVNESSCLGAQAKYNMSCTFYKQLGDDEGFCYEEDIDTFEIDDDDLALVMRTQCEQLDDEAECEDYGFCHYIHGVVPACRTLDLYCNLAAPISCSNYRNSTLCENDVRCDYHAVENTCQDLELATKDDLCGAHVTFCPKKDVMDDKIDPDDLSCDDLYEDVAEDFNVFEYFDATSSRQLRLKKKMLIKKCCVKLDECNTFKMETDAPSALATDAPVFAPSTLPHKSPTLTLAPTTREPTDAGETFPPTTSAPTPQPTPATTTATAATTMPKMAKTPLPTKKQPLPTKVTTAKTTPVNNNDNNDNTDANLNGTSSATKSSQSNSGVITAVVIVMLLVVIIGGAVWWRSRQKRSVAQFKTLYENPNWMGNDMGSSRKTDLLNDMY